jgi:hypothetical protein
MSDLLRFPADIEIQAGDAKKVPTISAVVYSGGVMNVNPFGAVAVDLANADVSGNIPILAQHDDSLSGLCGQGTAAVRNGAITLTGTLTDATPSGAQVISLARAGVNLQASIGYAPSKRETIPPREKITLNGKVLVAPDTGLTVVRAGRLREVSLLPLGADDSTSVHIAATADSSKKGTSIMEPTETENILKAERSRVAAIEAACTGLTFISDTIGERVTELRAKAISGEISVEALQAGILRVQKDDIALAKMRSERPQPPGVRASSRDVDPIQCLASGLLIRAGYSGLAEQAYGKPVAEVAAHGPARLNMLDLCRESLRSIGQVVPSHPNDIVRASFSTGSMPVALGQAAEKVLMDAYQTTSAAWRSWCKPESVSSFRDHQLIRPTFALSLERVAPGGEIKHGTWGEETATIRADTFAKLLRIDRRDAINDNAGVFATAASAMGRAAARSLADLIVTTLLAGLGDGFFTEARANLIDTPLSLTAVASAIALMRAKTDANGNSLDLQPKTLLVPPELESVARAICESEFVGVVDGSPTGNSLKGILTPVIEPRLSNANIEGASDTLWFLFASPADESQAVAFLSGVQNPTIEEIGLQGDVDTLGYSWRVYFDFGSSLVDFRAAVASTGS